MIALPTLRQMQFFVALARRKSFSKAADDCLVSQSTLSSAIKEMEGLLDQVLVDRSSRRFALTPTGEDVAERASAILASTEDLVRAARDAKPLEGPFKLGVIPTIAPFVLPRMTMRLEKEYPRLKLYLREDLTAALAGHLASGMLDAALLAFPYELPGMEVAEVGFDPFWFVCDRGHEYAKKKSLKNSDLDGVRLLLLEDGHCLRDHALEACDIDNRADASTFGGTSLFTLSQMARSGLGATLMPELAVQDGLAKNAGLAAIPFQDPKPGRTIGIAWRKGSGRREEARALARIAAELFFT